MDADWTAAYNFLNIFSKKFSLSDVSGSGMDRADRPQRPNLGTVFICMIVSSYQ